MPTVLIEQGFRFFFWSNENDEPMHIHVEKGGPKEKFGLNLMLKWHTCMDLLQKNKR